MTVRYEHNRSRFNILRQFYGIGKVEVGPVDTRHICKKYAAKFYSFRERLRRDRDKGSGFARDWYAIARCVSVRIYQRPDGTWWLLFHEDPLEKLRRAGALKKMTTDNEAA